MNLSAIWGREISREPSNEPPSSVSQEHPQLHPLPSIDSRPHNLSASSRPFLSEHQHHRHPTPATARLYCWHVRLRYAAVPIQLWMGRMIQPPIFTRQTLDLLRSKSRSLLDFGFNPPHRDGKLSFLQPGNHPSHQTRGVHEKDLDGAASHRTINQSV